MPNDVSFGPCIKTVLGAELVSHNLKLILLPCVKNPWTLVHSELTKKLSYHRSIQTLWWRALVNVKYTYVWRGIFNLLVWEVLLWQFMWCNFRTILDKNLLQCAPTYCKWQLYQILLSIRAWSFSMFRKYFPSWKAILYPSVTQYRVKQRCLTSNKK